MILINNQSDIDKLYLYAKDPYEAKYQHFINKCEKVRLKHYNDLNAFIEYSNDIDFYKNIQEYHPGQKIESNISFWWYDCWHD